MVKPGGTGTPSFVISASSPPLPPSSGRRALDPSALPFANGKADGSSALRPLLGGKGGELAEMTKLGVPVPPGFTITTEAWATYHAPGKKHPPGLWKQVLAHPAPL